MPEPDTTPAAKPARAPVAYSDGKGTLNTHCLTCPRPDGVDIPLTVDDVDHWEQCRTCGRYVVDVARGVPAPDDVHVCKPGATTYYCPTAGETESSCHGGFDVCCDRPDLHQPVPRCDRCGHPSDGHSIYGCHDECGCPDRPDLNQGTSGRTETGATTANVQAGGGEAGDSRADNAPCSCGGRGIAHLHSDRHEPAPAAPGLRDALEAALYPTYGQQDRERTRALTDAVLDVRDQEMERLRGAVRTLMRAHRDCGRDGEQMDGAHPPIHRWRVEHVDGDQWVPASGLKTDRGEAVHLLNVGNKNRPLWADGTPVQRRLVRETTSYAVEDALTPPADQDRGGQ